MNTFSRKNKDRGAAVVEFAVMATLLLIFLFGIFEFGFLWLSSYYIANSAREGARVAAKIGGTEDADITARENVADAAVDRYLAEHVMFASHLDEEGFVTTTYEDDSVTTADGETIIPLAKVTVKVNTSVVWEPILWPLMDILLPGDHGEIRDITQTASFAIE